MTRLMRRIDELYGKIESIVNNYEVEKSFGDFTKLLANLINLHPDQSVISEKITMLLEKKDINESALKEITIDISVTDDLFKYTSFPVSAFRIVEYLKSFYHQCDLKSKHKLNQLFSKVLCQAIENKNDFAIEIILTFYKNRVILDEV